MKEEEPLTLILHFKINEIIALKIFLILAHFNLNIFNKTKDTNNQQTKKNSQNTRNGKIFPEIEKA